MGRPVDIYKHERINDCGVRCQPALEDMPRGTWSSKQLSKMGKMFIFDSFPVQQKHKTRKKRHLRKEC